MRRLMYRRAIATTAALVLATGGLAACGGDDGDSPRAEDVPETAVAVVGETEVTKDQLADRVAALRRAQPKTAKSGGAAQAKQVRAQLEQQALSGLLLAAALEQEAADRGVEVSNAEVRQRWSAAAKDQFKSRKALRRFLGGQSRQDVIDQLRLQTLSERIHEQISEQAGGGKKGAKAVAEFQKDFQKRWQDRTACRDGQSAAGCPEPSE
jgi:ATP-dependent DNA ligase